MSKQLRIRVKKPWIAYPGTPIQQNYAEDLTHGYLQWDIDTPTDFGVKFRELPNPKPFITIDWLDDVDKTIERAVSTLPPKCRVRVRVKSHISQNESQKFSSAVKSKLDVVEVVWQTKDDATSGRQALQTNGITIQRDDLRNPELLVKLLRDYHANASVQVSDAEWKSVQELLKGYLGNAAVNDEVLRNVKWTLRRLSFDNTFSYGEGNVIDFQSLSGIVGIFGQNRVGKSSIVGTIMYALFNGTDRGSVKNIHVVNERKPYCLTNAIVNVAGMDYVIERQTTKNENKHGKINANTSLNVFRVRSETEIDDLAGEQRTDTEKVIKRLIGSSDDIMLTSMSTQEDLNQFIKHGSSRRSQYLSRFLDLDVMARVHDLVNKDVNSFKSQLKVYAGLDDAVIEKKRGELVDVESALAQVADRAETIADELVALRQKVSLNKDTTIVTQAEVDAQRKRVHTIKENIISAELVISEHGDKVQKLNQKLATIAQVKQEHDINDLRSRLTALHSLEGNISAVKHQTDKERSLYEQQKKSLKILDEVPCGDSFPTCKFIADAHLNKPLVDEQKKKVDALDVQLSEMIENLRVLKTEKLADKVKKIEQVYDLETEIRLKLSKFDVDLVKAEASLESSRIDLVDAESKLAELEHALKNDENAEVALLRSKIAKFIELSKKAEAEKVRLATLRGKITSDIEKYESEIVKRDELSMRLKLHELISTAFSKKGLPTIIVNSQLPLINNEISKILHGIVDFTIELEVDQDSDSLEAYINYGDSRRIIELASGMEKMIASVAIRVALVNISTLPKTDMFIIDEGFGALDAAGVEACNRLLMSLKRYFRLVIVITHVDGVKDAADHILEITKNEKDTKVHYVSSP